MSSPRIVLASSSPYRRALLARLNLEFETDSPDVDESPLEGEAPQDRAVRLAETKARAVASRHPGTVVIGSDQVAALGTVHLGKPGDRSRAIAQLSECSGRTVLFHTGVCVITADAGFVSTALDTTRVDYRELARETIERYVDLEQPFDCAGSAKAEGLGISLVRAIHSTDPTGIIGLPLITLVEMLARHRIEIP